ncbi:MAG TPA: glycoside hydrolase family 76 protein [Fimbriimonadaceae bacterium]|nr:glycoside hydrolase family 76 protein [Fimbriimonadaceae bacterium]
MLVALSSLQEPDFAKRGEESLQMLRRDYLITTSKLYAERPDKKQPAFNWGVGVMLSALNSAAKHNPKFRPWLREYADASRVYWNQGGYDVLPVPKPLDRYYDDNAWMALALVETYEVLGDKKYLTWARGALDFALEGESKDGGIFWRESDRASRNTRSNAPTAVACLAVSRHTKEKRLVDKARELTLWTRKHLEDPSDGLYWDNLGNDGRIDKTKWTYNTALMIRAIHELKLDGLDRVMRSSQRHWLRDGKIADPGRFSHLLLEAWVSVEGVRPEYKRALEIVSGARSSNGHYPDHWAKLSVPKNPEILDQASFARACFFLANR